jgi:hypothetical protein
MEIPSDNEATKFASPGKQGIDWKSYDTRHAEFGTIEIGSRGFSLNSGVMYCVVSAKFFREIAAVARGVEGYCAFQNLCSLAESCAHHFFRILEY